MHKLGMCKCESATCVSGVLLDKYGQEVEGSEHDAGDCPSEATRLIRIYGQKQRLCQDCYTCTVSILGIPHTIIVEVKSVPNMTDKRLTNLKRRTTYNAHARGHVLSRDGQFMRTGSVWDDNDIAHCVMCRGQVQVWIDETGQHVEGLEDTCKEAGMLAL